MWSVNQSQTQPSSGDMGKKENPEVAKAPQMLNAESPYKKLHDFIRTHFHRATHCDFCTKKVRIFYLIDGSASA